MAKKIVVVLTGGSPVELPFVDDVQGVLHGLLCGQGGATALAQIIMGAVNPSGKLAMSYPLAYEDAPTAGNYPGQERTAEHREGLYVGYRYYDTRNVSVRFAFGQGLSYTSFAYSDLQADAQGVTIRVTNTGERAGQEIVQVYIGAPQASYYTPRHELKGFTKVSLEPGERHIEVGASSRDIRLTKTVYIDGEALSERRNDIPSYYSGDVQQVSREEFANLYGDKLPAQQWDQQAPFQMTDTVRQLAYQNWMGKTAYGAIRGVRRVLFWIGKPGYANYVMFIIDMPFSKVARSAGPKDAARIAAFVRRVSKHKPPKQ